MFDEIQISRTQIAGQSVFPLPITPMELFMKWDHSAEYPKRFRVRMNFAEPLDDLRCIKAFQVAIARHPMLIAELSETDPDAIDQTTNWIIPEIPSFLFGVSTIKGTISTNSINDEGIIRQNQIATDDDSTQFRVHNEYIPPISSSDDRVAIVLIDTQTAGIPDINCQLLLDIPHHRCDGLAARQLVNDFFNIYDALTVNNDFESRLPTLDHDQLTTRSAWYRPTSGRISHETTPLEKLINAIKFHSMNPKSIGGKIDPTRDKKSAPCNHHLIERCTIIEPNEFSYLQESTQNDTSLNQRGLVGIAETIRGWSRRSTTGKQPTSGHHAYRLMMPINLRTHADRRLSACNRIGFGFVVFRNRWPQDRFIREIKQQSEMILERQLGFDFAEGLSHALRSKILSSFVRKSLPRSSMATSIVTNLGDVSRRIRKKFSVVNGEPVIGGVRLVSVSGIAPLRPHSHLGVGLCVTSGRLSISTFIDEHYVADNANCLHDQIVARIMNPTQLVEPGIETNHSALNGG